jgi:hypothetical protein
MLEMQNSGVPKCVGLLSLAMLKRVEWNTKRVPDHKVYFQCPQLASQALRDRRKDRSGAPSPEVHPSLYSPPPTPPPTPPPPSPLPTPPPTPPASPPPEAEIMEKEKEKKRGSQRDIAISLSGKSFSLDAEDEALFGAEMQTEE